MGQRVKDLGEVQQGLQDWADEIKFDLVGGC